MNLNKLHIYILRNFISGTQTLHISRILTSSVIPNLFIQSARSNVSFFIILVWQQLTTVLHSKSQVPIMISQNFFAAMNTLRLQTKRISRIFRGGGGVQKELKKHQNFLHALLLLFYEPDKNCTIPPWTWPCLGQPWISNLKTLLN